MLRGKNDTRVGSCCVVLILICLLSLFSFQEKAGTIFTLVDSSKREHLGMM